MKRKIRRSNEAVTPVQSGPGTNQVIKNLLDFMTTQGIKTIGNVDKTTLEAVLADSLKRGEPIKVVNNKVMITMESTKPARRTSRTNESWTRSKMLDSLVNNNRRLLDLTTQMNRDFDLGEYRGQYIDEHESEYYLKRILDGVDDKATTKEFTDTLLNYRSYVKGMKSFVTKNLPKDLVPLYYRDLDQIDLMYKDLEELISTGHYSQVK